MVSLRQLSLLVCVLAVSTFSTSVTASSEIASAAISPPTRQLLAQHNGEVHQAGNGAGGVISPGGGDINPNTGVKNPGGILGPLYAAYPQLFAPLAMASDNVHNSNAAVSGVQHTPDGIFQARRLRAEHNGEVHQTDPGAGGVISPGGGDINPDTGVKNPGGILGPLYAAFPQLLAPLAMASDNVHNSNAAVSGVQHTPDGIFQA